MTEEQAGRRETATLAGGCFWCLEAVYDLLKGVEDVTSGYAGGTAKNPSYEQVCSGMTGHAEVVQIGFDPSVISFKDLLEVFFTIHDPTTLNRQGYDVGTQVEPLDTFYPAEEYHQRYFERNPNQSYCRAIVAPKVAKARSHFIQQL